MTLENLDLDKLVSLREELAYLSKYKSAETLLDKVSEIIKKKKCYLESLINNYYKATSRGRINYYYIKSINISKIGKIKIDYNFASYNRSTGKYTLEETEKLIVKGNNLMISGTNSSCIPITKKHWDRVNQSFCH
jgi:predicted Mrr-cat superfamily restriction endonuclease